MNRTLVVIVALAVLVLGSAVSANASPRVRVNVPFEFHAGAGILPAGEYFVEFRSAGAAAVGSMLHILNSDGFVVQILPAMPGDSIVPADCLVFNRYGEDYFLAKACQGSWSATPYKTRAEREVELAYSKSQRPRAVVIAATN